MGIIETIQQIAREHDRQQEKELIKGMTVNGEVEAKGVTSTINDIRAAVAAVTQCKTEVIILNATTAAAIRRQVGDLPGVQMVITNAVDTGTVYKVVNEELRKQLLSAMGERW